jgi:hypothetical protein
MSKQPYKTIMGSFEGHLNIIGYTLRAIISGFIVQGLFSQPLIC